MMDREEYEARARRIEHCASSDVAALASDVLTLAAALEKARAERDAAIRAEVAEERARCMQALAEREAALGAELDAARAERDDLSDRYAALLREERAAQRTIAELRQVRSRG